MALIAALLACGLAAGIYSTGWLPSANLATTPPAQHTLGIPARPPAAPVNSFAPGTESVAALRDETFEIAETAVRLLPNNPDALCLLGSVHHRYNNEAAAVLLWQECLRLNPRFADAHHSLGLRAIAAGDFVTAETHLREAARIDPSWMDVPLPLAESLLRQGKFREVVAVLKPLAATHPQREVAWCRLGQAYHQLEDYENARRCHEQAVAASPASCDARHGVALACERLGLADEARGHLEALRTLRESEIRSNWEHRTSFTDEGRARKAALQTSITAARVYLVHGKFAEAEARWRRAAQLEPTDRESRAALIQWLSRQARWSEAIPLGRELCELEPDQPQAWTSLGHLLAKEGQTSEAEAAFLRAVQLAPQQAEAYAALAELHVAPGRSAAEALPFAQQAVALAPTAHHHFLLATAHWRAGDAASARAALEQAIRLNPNEPEYRLAYTRLDHPPP